MQKRKGRNASARAKEVYLLSGLVRCSKCGSIMSGNRKTTHAGKSHHIIYRCSKRDKAGTGQCDTKSINKNYLESAVAHYLTQLCVGSNLKQITVAVQEYSNEQNGNKQDIAICQKQLDRIDREIKNIINAIKNGFALEELQSEYEQLKNQKTQTELKLDKLKKQAPCLPNLSDIQIRNALKEVQQEITSGNSKEEYKHLFEVFINSVDVYEGYVDIALNVLALLGLQRYSNVLSRKKQTPQSQSLVVSTSGGDEGDRTPYLLNAIQALSQVSYTPTGDKALTAPHFLSALLYYQKCGAMSSPKLLFFTDFIACCLRTR